MGNEQWRQERNRLVWWNVKHWSKRVLAWAAIAAAVFYLGYAAGHEKGYYAGRKAAKSDFLNEPFESLFTDPIISDRGCRFSVTMLSSDAKRHLRPEVLALAKSLQREDDLGLGAVVIRAWGSVLQEAEQYELGQ